MLKEEEHEMLKRASIVLLTLLLIFPMNIESALAHNYGNLTNDDKTEVSPNVVHSKQKFSNGSSNRVVNILDINLNTPYTSIEVGLNNPYNRLAKTSALAKLHNYAGHRVVGAINAAYFIYNGDPSTLIAVNNEIIHYGALGTGKESPIVQPVAFGVSANGKAVADYYKVNNTYEINGKTFGITGINRVRYADEAILYTEKVASTGSNEWGLEIVVENANKSTKNLGFGDVVTGTVKAITQYPAKGNNAVPTNGFVISLNGKAINDEVKKLKVGDPVKISIGIDEKWQNAQFILGAGPLLVKDGKVNITMDLSSSFASVRHPRTAVGINERTNQVFFVTVDGRQTGVSIGSTLKELAEYLISLGATAAINLDGGGSTTMVVRKPGGAEPAIVNVPSDKNERSVSAILEVINSAPKGQAKVITLQNQSATVNPYDSITVNVKSAYDEYLNPMTLNANEVIWTVEGNIGYMEGNKFTATNPGNGKIVGTSGYAKVEMNITVENYPDVPIMISSFESLSDWKIDQGEAKLNSEFARVGKYSYAQSYDFSSSNNNTSKITLTSVNNLSMKGRPHSVGVWVNSDSNVQKLKGIVVDGKGNEQSVDFSMKQATGEEGWKYYVATIPESLTAPVYFKQLIVETKEKAKGKFFVDQLQVMYNPDYVEPLFKDVANDFWAKDVIKELNERGLIKGYSNGSFKPNDNIIRADAAIIMARLLKKPVTKIYSFEDLSESHYAYNDIQSAVNGGIFEGYENGTFKPKNNITRAETATILQRHYKFKGAGDVKFSDVKETNWAYDNIVALYKNGIIEGYENGTFKPDQSITRAEFATMLSRAINKK